MRYLLLALLLLQSCTTVPVKTPDSPVLPLPSEGELVFQPEATTTTDKEKEIILKAEKLIKEVVHGQCFKDFMVARKLEETEGKTPEQVVESLRTYKGMIPVSMYYKRFTSAVAYRQPPEPTIYLNRRNFFPTLPLCNWGSTMMHEASHTIGYGHSFTNPSDYSVPYSINRAFEACCK